MKWHIWKSLYSGYWYACGLYFKRFDTFREAVDDATAHPLPTEES